MPRQGHRGMIMDGLNMPNKIRKRGCSSSSSSSSRVHNYRLNKRAILVGKNRTGLGIGLGRSRSSTPAPAWRTTPMRSVIDSPKYSISKQSTRPVSARMLAATLWEMNEMPSPKMSESNLEVMKKKNGSKMMFKREKMQSLWGLHSGSGYLPPHLSDPSHSPTGSEKFDRSGTGSRHRRTSSISQKLMSANQNVDSISNASFMEVETRSRPPTSSGSVISKQNRLKDVSNALTTSKELLKIINRIWAHADQPSSSMSLISALHSELERARLQVNHVIQDQRSDKTEVNYLMKCFAEEKASWKNKEHQAVESAIASIVSELDAERKIRKRLESLNKKLGKELSETKSSFIKAVKELESEKRAREITEQVCEELAKNIDEDRAEKERLKRESIKVHEEVEKEREMLELADKLREERVQMKLYEAKHQYEEKNSAIGKLRRQLEVFLGSKRDKDKSNIINSHQIDQENDDEDGLDSKEESLESDLHSIELNVDDNSKGYKWAYDPRKMVKNSEIKARNSISGPVSRKGVSLQRAVSDVVGSDKEGVLETSRRSYFDETQRYRSVKGVKDHVLSGSKLASIGDYQYSAKSRNGDVRGEGQSTTRRSKWGGF